MLAPFFRRAMLVGPGTGMDSMDCMDYMDYMDPVRPADFHVFYKSGRSIENSKAFGSPRALLGWFAVGFPIGRR